MLTNFISNLILCQYLGETFVTRKVTRTVAKIKLGIQDEVCDALTYEAYFKET